MEGSFLSCIVEKNEKRVPIAVSVTSDKCESPGNLLKVENDKDNYKGRRYHITACLGQIYHGYDNVNQLVEMLEVNHILGVDLMVLYNHTSSQSVYPYIQSFQQDGLLDFYNWYHPLTERVVGTHFFGNFILRNDCLYRYMYRSDYIIMTDIDEVIVPIENNRTLPALMSYISRSKGAEYNFRHVCIPDEWPSDPSVKSLYNVANKYHIRTLLKTNRTREPHPRLHRSKYIVKPEHVVIAGVHTCESYVSRLFKRKHIHPQIGQLFHYRTSVTGTKLKLGTIVDKTMHRFAADIVTKISKRHEINQH